MWAEGELKTVHRLQQVRDDDQIKSYRDGRCNNNAIDLDPGTSGEAPLRNATTEPGPHHRCSLFVRACHDVCRCFLSSFLFPLSSLPDKPHVNSADYKVQCHCYAASSTRRRLFNLYSLQHNNHPLSKATATTTHNPRIRHYRSLSQRHRTWRPKDKQDLVGSTIETPPHWSCDKMPGNPLEDSEPQDRSPYIGRKDRGFGYGRRQSCCFESRQRKEEKG